MPALLGGLGETFEFYVAHFYHLEWLPTPPTLQDSVSGSVLSVITDRSQGGSSQVDGGLEVMVQVRICD